MKRILFTGGGSAGHVIPNIALIDELLSTGEADIFYMGTDGIEKRLLADKKLPYYQIDCPKLIRGGGMYGLKRNFGIPISFLRARKSALSHLKKLRPDLVFSKGGYVALPVISAAQKLHIPCLAHESDFSAGLSNRLSARKCKYVFTSFPETAKSIPHGKYSGAPIRKSIFQSTKKDARKAFSIPMSEKVLLIFGGGSGSAVINDAVRKHLRLLIKDYTILHVCGKGNVIESNVKRYRQYEFIADMGTAYACADLVISRAGSGTVFEILALKKPAIFIPLEGQTRGDQIENSTYFEKKGLCHVLRQKELDRLPSAIETAFFDKEMKERLAKTKFGRGNENILREIRKILNR